MKILIFVYNTNSGFYHSIKNHFHRLISKKDYACKLHRLVYGKIFMKRSWRNFIGDLSYQKVFFFKKEFKKAHPEYAYLELPSILVKDDSGIKVLMTAQEINSVADTDELIGILGNKLT